MTHGSRETMWQVAQDKKELASRVLEGQTGIRIEWSRTQAALGLGLPADLFNRLQGRTLRADVGENSVTIRITDQALEAQDLGRQLWQDLVAGFSAETKDQTAWKRTYNFLTLILSAGYQQNKNLKPMLRMAEIMRVIDSRAFGMSSFHSIYDHIMSGGDITGLDLELADLHLAAAGIYWGILGPGTREEVLPPETIGSAATR